MTPEKKFNPNDYMIDLRGKKYLPVNARLAWFRAEHPTGSIDNDVIAIADMVLMRARVIVDGVVIATGHATKRSGQGQTWAGREIEKAETAAMGRALAVAGYGTMNADDELDDTGYLSDAPVDKPARAQLVTNAKTNLNPAKPGRPTITPPEGFTPHTEAPADPDTDETTANDIVSYIEVRATSDGKPYIVAEGGLTSFTREPFRKAGIACDDWTTPGDKHVLDKPLLVRYAEKNGYKNIVEVEAA